MNYELMSSTDFKEELAKRRERIFFKISKKGSLVAEKILNIEFENLSADAAGGDPVAQDLLAEWFRNGNQVVPENIELSNKWLFLAGANGNKYSLDRLRLHFSYAFEKVASIPDFEEICIKHDIFRENFQYVIGKLLCDAVCDDLHIDALELAKREVEPLPFSSIIMRQFDRAIDRATDRVIEYLRR